MMIITMAIYALQTPLRVAHAKPSGPKSDYFANICNHSVVSTELRDGYLHIALDMRDLGGQAAV